MRVDYASDGSELTSGRWLETLARVPKLLRGDTRGAIELDLSSVTWLSHLPLMAICLGVQELANAKFDERRMIMPEKESVRAFLDRWGFYTFVGRHGFAIESDLIEKTYSQSASRSTVLGISEFKQESDAEELRETFRSHTNTRLRNLLLTGAFLDERDIQGLADLIIFELCQNSVEHAGTSRAAIIFGHVSRDNDPARPVYEQGAATWENAFF